MAFAMSLPRTKRVKYIEPDGKEAYQEEDRWTLVRAVHNQGVQLYPAFSHASLFNYTQSAAMGLLEQSPCKFLPQQSWQGPVDVSIPLKHAGRLG